MRVISSTEVHLIALSTTVAIFARDKKVKKLF